MSTQAVLTVIFVITLDTEQQRTRVRVRVEEEEDVASVTGCSDEKPDQEKR